MCIWKCLPKCKSGAPHAQDRTGGGLTEDFSREAGMDLLQAWADKDNPLTSPTIVHQLFNVGPSLAGGQCGSLHQRRLLACCTCAGSGRSVFAPKEL